MYTICTHSHKNRRVVSILSTTAILAVLSDVKIVLEQVKQIQATDTSLSSTESTSFQSPTVLWQTTLCFRSDKKLTYQLTMYGFKGLCVNFSINKLCLTLSKAFEKSIVNSLTALLSLLSKAWRNSCCILRSAFVQLPPFCTQTGYYSSNSPHLLYQRCYTLLAQKS